MEFLSPFRLTSVLRAATAYGVRLGCQPPGHGVPRAARLEGHFPVRRPACGVLRVLFSDRLIGALGWVCGLTFVILREDF
jgi:hypothetical protein